MPQIWIWIAHLSVLGKTSLIIFAFFVGFVCVCACFVVCLFVEVGVEVVVVDLQVFFNYSF